MLLLLLQLLLRDRLLLLLLLLADDRVLLLLLMLLLLMLVSWRGPRIERPLAAATLLEGECRATGHCRVALQQAGLPPHLLLLLHRNAGIRRVTGVRRHRASVCTAAPRRGMLGDSV